MALVVLFASGYFLVRPKIANIENRLSKNQSLDQMTEQNAPASLTQQKPTVSETSTPKLSPTPKQPVPSSTLTPALPQISLSSNTPLQGDTVLIEVKNAPKTTSTTQIAGELGTTKINFFEAANEIFGILGIGAQKTPGNYRLTITLSNGMKLTKNITVVKKNFPITRLTFTPELEEEGYNATTVADNTISEDSKLYAAMATSSPKALFNKSFVYPLDKIINVGPFGNIRQSGNISLQHLGTDLQASMDSNVYAINNGIVKATLTLADYGNMIIIDHGAGIFSLYLHLDKFKVKTGQKVTRGQVIGLSGDTGYSIAPHLHFSVKINGASVDPIKFIQTAQF